VKHRGYRFLAAAFVSITLVATALASAPTLVERIRYIGTVSYSRVVVDLSGPAKYRMLSVLAEGTSGPADRLVVDVSGAKIGAEAREPLEVGDGMLRGIRTGQYTLDTARVVLDLAREVDAQAFVLPDPYRLVIDLRQKGRRQVGGETTIVRASGGRSGSRSAESVDRSASPPATRSDRPAPELPAKAEPITPPAVDEAKKAPRLKVVIDPGHGGKDPGARGWRGVEEKDVVLAIAKLLAERLRADGIDVAMTRTDDRFLALEERTGFANAQGADLFISVHANASTNPALRGVEIYYLNNTDNRGTLRLAALENNLRWNPHDPKLQSAIPDLSYILSDLRQTYKVEESKQLAEELQHAVVSRLDGDYERVDDLGVKEGPFYVLVGAYMPCVLVEVSFLTNPLEGARLATEEYRSALADGIHQGIRRYIAQTRLAKTL
jgi:N-acetylmuramoyl-L-alanine amidase